MYSEGKTISRDGVAVLAAEGRRSPSSAGYAPVTTSAS
jgi:hypothetical protein